MKASAFAPVTLQLAFVALFFLLRREKREEEEAPRCHKLQSSTLELSRAVENRERRRTRLRKECRRMRMLPG